MAKHTSGVVRGRRFWSAEPVAPKSEREEVFRCLLQLAPHAPNWVATIRKYIVKIEGRKKRAKR